jgi:NADPH-dependent 2,4-dienoyl-CoA reductase/sulfur reductase-like enzyme
MQNMESCDILIIGAGAAGIAAAKAAATAGCEKILLVDRKNDLGGILLQCFHHGFGCKLSGPEFVQELLEDFPAEIVWQPNTTVLSVSKEKTALLSSAEFGRRTVAFRQLILATGCREIPLGALPIGGTRPLGIYTAGQMQAMMNLHGFLPEGPAVILGSGDIGLVMANHMAEKGIAVTLVEQRPQCGGMAKNKKCLKQYPIKLHCSTTIREVCGEKILEGVILSDGTFLPCRTLLVAAGLRPERDLVYDLADVNWLHTCGNCNTVHPIVEAVVSEGELAGFSAYENIRGSL